MILMTAQASSEVAPRGPLFRSWGGRFADPAVESAFAEHRLARSARSLAVAAMVMAVPWIAFIPVDLVVAPSTGAAATSVAARLVGASALLVTAGGLWRSPRRVYRLFGGYYIDAAAFAASASLLVVSAARPAHFGTLQLAAVVFGIGLLLFAPTSLVRRSFLAATFWGGFVSVAAWRSPEVGVDPLLLAANLAMVLMCTIVCSAHLDHTARNAFWHLTTSEQLNDRLAAEIAASEALRAVLARRADEDDLTGLFNRRAFFDAAEVLGSQLDVGSAPAVTMVIDADSFKAVNDTYGHATGDVVLRDLADSLRSCLRDRDVLGRLGGEEFCAFLPDTRIEQALVVADRLREATLRRSATGGPDRIPVSISIGLAERRPGEPLEDVLHRADRAMYEAKRAGGDRIEVAAEDLLDAAPPRGLLDDLSASSHEA